MQNPLRRRPKAADRRILRGNDGLPGRRQQPHGRYDRFRGCCCGRGFQVISFLTIVPSAFHAEGTFLSDHVQWQPATGRLRRFLLAIQCIAHHGRYDRLRGCCCGRGFQVISFYNPHVASADAGATFNARPRTYILSFIAVCSCKEWFFGV